MLLDHLLHVFVASDNQQKTDHTRVDQNRGKTCGLLLPAVKTPDFLDRHRLRSQNQEVVLFFGEMTSLMSLMNVLNHGSSRPAE